MEEYQYVVSIYKVIAIVFLFIFLVFLYRQWKLMNNVKDLREKICHEDDERIYMNMSYEDLKKRLHYIYFVECDIKKVYKEIDKYIFYNVYWILISNTVKYDSSMGKHRYTDSFKTLFVEDFVVDKLKVINRLKKVNNNSFSDIMQEYKMNDNLYEFIYNNSNYSIKK